MVWWAGGWEWLISTMVFHVFPEIHERRPALYFHVQVEDMYGFAVVCVGGQRIPIAAASLRSGQTPSSGVINDYEWGILERPSLGFPESRSRT